MAPCYGWRSPHTRGARGQALRRLGPRRIIPAYAGSTDGPHTISKRRWDHPRIRGEHVTATTAEARPEGSSPHTRGARGSGPGQRPGRRIIPAYAGSTPGVNLRGVFFHGSSPHTRGAHHPDKTASGAGRIIPAYAGSTRTRPAARTPHRDHPRIRGEHAVQRPTGVPPLGSSPHTRGALDELRDRHSAFRIIPAYAGSTEAYLQVEPFQPDHPRIRGEHLPVRLERNVEVGSSPHTRGARFKVVAYLDALGIIPAYAGSTSRPRRRRRTRADHPRIRGEHAALASQAHSIAGSSPHTRGAPWRPGVCRWGARIIPAYAGSTPSATASPRVRRDHPRIRGEHVDQMVVIELEPGSSPHTRGAP